MGIVSPAADRSAESRLDMTTSSEDLSATRRYKYRYKRESLRRVQKRNRKPLNDLRLRAAGKSEEAELRGQRAPMLELGTTLRRLRFGRMT